MEDFVYYDVTESGTKEFRDAMVGDLVWVRQIGLIEPLEKTYRRYAAYLNYQTKRARKISWRKLTRMQKQRALLYIHQKGKIPL